MTFDLGLEFTLADEKTLVEFLLKVLSSEVHNLKKSLTQTQVDFVKKSEYLNVYQKKDFEAYAKSQKITEEFNYFTVNVENLKDALRMVKQPSYLIVEHFSNDWESYMYIFEKFKNHKDNKIAKNAKLVCKAADFKTNKFKKELKPISFGGKGSTYACVKRLTDKEGFQDIIHQKCIGILDKDADNSSVNIAEKCLHDFKINVLVLKKRSLENYIPKEMLKGKLSNKEYTNYCQNPDGFKIEITKEEVPDFFRKAKLTEIQGSEEFIEIIEKIARII